MNQEQLTHEGTALVSQSEELVVVDADSFASAGVLLRSVKQYLARVEEVFGPIVSSAHAAWKTALAQRKGVEQHALTAERILKDRMATYQVVEERKRREAEEVARIERERLEAVERTRVADEEGRRLKEAEDRLLVEVAAAEAIGDQARADAIISAPIVVEPITPRPVFVAPIPVPLPSKVDGVSFREDWDFEIMDETLIPRTFLSVDEKKIRGVVKALKGAANIPGIRIFSRLTSAVRA